MTNRRTSFWGAVGLVLCVICAVAGLAGIAWLVFLTVGIGAWASNK